MAMQNGTAVSATERTASGLEQSRAQQSASLTAWLSTSKAVLFTFWPRSQSRTCFSLVLLAFVFFPVFWCKRTPLPQKGRKRGDGFKLHGVTFPASYNIKRKINLNYIHRPSPYRAVNTLRLCYTNQPVNVV